MSKKLWGGRFRKKMDKDFEEFSKSIQYDYKLAEFDVLYSFCHVVALKEAGILDKKEGDKLFTALKEIENQIAQGKFKPGLSCEDIHTDIRNRVEKKAGKLALKLHSLRSRNDQIVFDEKFYCLIAAFEIALALSDFGRNLVFFAKKNINQLFVGYTHTQKAQVILFRDYLCAYSDMFTRDEERLTRFLDSLSIYIGAGALAGSALTRGSYEKAIKKIASVLKKIEEVDLHISVVKNSLDNVSDRDYIIEFLSILSIIQMHLSRMAEDFILYSTKEFNFFDLPEEFCTGSSLMPHKKNPDFLELVRGSTGKVYGNLMSILTTMKGLPLAYNRDMQMDKEPLFSSVETVKDELRIMAKFIKEIKLKKKNIEKALEDEHLYATEIAEFLVTQKKVAFKTAHDIAGKLIRYSEDKKAKIKDMQDRLLKTFHPVLDAETLKKIMTPEYAIKSKKSVWRKLPKLKK